MDTTRKRVLLTLGAVLTVATIGVGAVSLALFSNQAVVNNNAFTAGTLIITTDHPSTAIVSYSNMAPGDSITAPLLVSNAGTLALRYALTSVATNELVTPLGLKDQLVLTIKTGVSACNSVDWVTDGVVQYTGDLDFTNGKLIGDVAAGQTGGVPGTAGADRVLAAGASETLCFRVSLPSNTGDAFQGATTTATFTFAAEQTKNN
jgi:predicted ribosomally synthesized peptide with SipW-like signal peptide